MVDVDRVARFGRLVELVPLGMSSLDALYEIVVAGGAGALWRTRGRTVSREQLAGILWEAGDCAFSVTDRSTGSAVGFVGLFGHDLVSSVASVSAFFDQRLENRVTIAGDALEVFCRYVFGVLGVRKLTAEIPGPLAAGMRRASARLSFIDLEGTLRQHSRFGRSFADVDVYAIWADRFIEWEHRQRATTRAGNDSSMVVLRRALEDVLDSEVPDPLDGGYRLVDDLGVDSLALIEMIEHIESATGVLIPDQVLGDVATVQDLLTVLEHGRTLKASTGT